MWGLSNIPLPQNPPLAVPFADLSRSFAAQGKPTKTSSDDDKKAYMKTHIIVPFRRPFRRAFADLSRPQKSTDFASHMFWLYIKHKQGF